MDKRIAVPLLVAACAAPSYAYDYTDTAEVVSAVPIYETVNEPRQQCWTESVTYYEETRVSNGGAIIGGITGGLLGAQVGKGNGGSNTYIVPQSHMVRPSVTHITYIDHRDVPVWKKKPYKRPKHDRGWDD